MEIIYSPRDLRQFERELISYYEVNGLDVPLHLSGGNEFQLIRIFREINKKDWVFASHRNHFHALLKGMPKETVRTKIMDGESMTLMDREHRFYGSGIVSGHLPIALGVAQAIRQRKEDHHVWAFCGDMAARTGSFHECVSYAEGHNLPIKFVVEDNGRSVRSPTEEIWGKERTNKVQRYTFVPTFPHHGFKEGGTF